MTVDFSVVGLPQSFLSALSMLKKQPYYWLYPVFWQVFLWGWGGFILNDREDEELTELSAQTGLPREEIPNALQALDWFFPMRDGSWFVQMPTASYRFVKLVPSPFCGIGAFQRFIKSGVEHYRELGLGGRYTVQDLARWHNSGVALLG